MAKQLTENQRGRLAEQVMQWGNLVFIGLVITQIIPRQPEFDWPIAGIGVALFAGAYYIAHRVMKGGQ